MNKENASLENFSLLDLAQDLKDFLNEKIAPELKILALKKWSFRKNTNLLIIVRKINGFASLNECSNIHKLVKMWLKNSNLDPNAFKISIESESLEQVLFDIQDYHQNLNKKIKIELKDKINDRKNFVGFLIELKNDIIFLKSEDNAIHEINFDNIRKAKILGDF